MCGIVGYAGGRNAADIILSGLKRLEYRGYDSAGMALQPQDADSLTLLRRAGKISNLEAAFTQTPPGPATLGIGHTRWATHGQPTETNAHPHLSRSGTFAIVHNGIIDNYAQLRDKLIAEGFPFSSETDSEVIAHLIEACYDGDLRQAVATALEKLEGTYGIVAISAHHPGQLIAARQGSPIAVGICKNETIVASDVSAIVNHTDQVIFLDDGDILTATGDAIDITSRKNMPVSRVLTRIDWDLGAIEKAGYAHFMLKEIFEQPQAIGNTIRGRLLPKDGTAKLSGMHMDAAEMARINRISIAACGTSYYAGVVGKYYFEDIASVPTDVQQAADFRDRNPIILRDTCMLAISQSGETADTLAAVREGTRKGASILSICNVVGSTIAREAGRGVYLHAGPEIGVASTKAFTCQVSVMAMMAILMGRTRRLSQVDGQQMINAIESLPTLCEQVLAQNDAIRKLATRYADKNDFFYIGRGYMFPVAMEGALKLKEISYIHAEGYHAAELKHGPIALLGDEVPVVAAVPTIPGHEKTIANMQECRARRSPVVAMATEGNQTILNYCDDVIWLPPCPAFVSPIPVVIAEQLFAYHIADLRACEIDQPRNLAKSVTVE